MTIETKCAFTYGHTIDDSNQAINFDEGSGELLAEITIGEYTLGDFVNAVATAMNLAGTQEYTVTVDRTTRKLTISAAASFSLLPVTGTQSTISAFSLMGYSLDVSGTNVYESDAASGSLYRPQFLLQNFIDFVDDIESANSSVNQSASGRVETISYGKVQFMSANITLATDIVPQGVIEDNVNGVSDLRAFMNYIITKAPIEFVADIDNDPSTLTECLVEKTPESKDGVSFKLKELYTRGLTGYFETGLLRFRKIV